MILANKVEKVENITLKKTNIIAGIKQMRSVVPDWLKDKVYIDKRVSANEKKIH